MTTPLPKYRPSFTLPELLAIRDSLHAATQSDPANSNAASALGTVSLMISKIELGMKKADYVQTGKLPSATELTRDQVLGLAVPPELATNVDWESPETWKRSYGICELASITGMAVSQLDAIAAKKHAEATGAPVLEVKIIGEQGSN